MLTPNRSPKVMVHRGLDSFSVSYSTCSWTTGGGGRASAVSGPERLRPRLGCRPAARADATQRLGTPPNPDYPAGMSKDSTGEVHTVVLVEASVLHCDDRSREVLAEVVFADRSLVLGGLELAYLVAVHVVDGGVLNEVRVPALEPVLVDVDYVGVEARDDD